MRSERNAKSTASVGLYFAEYWKVRSIYYQTDALLDERPDTPVRRAMSAIQVAT